MIFFVILAIKNDFNCITNFYTTTIERFPNLDLLMYRAKNKTCELNSIILILISVNKNGGVCGVNKNGGVA